MMHGLFFFIFDDKISIHYLPGGLEEFAQQVVPELQRKRIVPDGVRE